MSRQADSRPWFAPRTGRHGIRPCSPQGWGAIAAYLVVLGGVAVAVGRMGAGGDVANRFGYLAGGLVIMGAVTALFVTIVRRKTAGNDGHGVGK